MSAESAARSSSSRSMRLMKDLSWSLAKPDLAMDGPNFQKPRKLAPTAPPAQCAKLCAAVHIIERCIKHRLQPGCNGLCLCVGGNQILPHLDQHMRQAAHGAVAPQRVTF